MSGTPSGGSRPEVDGWAAGNGAPSGLGAPALSRTIGRLAPLAARVALGAGFLSAVADRLGLWGPPGAAGIAWGSFDRFLAYAETLNPWFPGAWIPAVGVAVTAAEVVLGLGLLVGWRTRALGAAAGLLLLLFGIGMTAGTGLKSALDASVFAAAAAGFLLLRTGGGPLSVDRVTGAAARTEGNP